MTNNAMPTIAGRYINNLHLEPFLHSLNEDIFHVYEAGFSVEKKPIFRVDFGSGKFKILLWSQMHGNESTTTKAVVDLLEFIQLNGKQEWLSEFTFCFIPILNPDGAVNYTRVNANGVDLNRDSKDLSQPESLVLRQIFDEFKPDLALNMHDQRTIFGVGNENKPATISFLAPSYNEARDLNETRLFAMQLISCMNDALQDDIPGQVGRFDDSFNINCIGDMFTYLKVPTILFEAGHYPSDYEREETRKLVFKSLVVLLDSLLTKSYQKFTYEMYQDIPENEKTFVDVLIKNYETTNEFFKNRVGLPVFFKETLANGRIEFLPTIDFEVAPNFKYGHIELDFNRLEINSEKQLEAYLKELT